MDQKAFFSLSYGLYVISSTSNGKDNACIANTFMQITAEPAKVCVTLHKDNYTTTLIQESKIFNCGVLLDAVKMETIGHFGFKTGRNVGKFEGIASQVDGLGIKQITNDLAADFSCKVTEIIDVGTHIMFIGEVVGCRSLSDSPVLTYANYHRLKNGKTPKLAPSYVKEEKKTGYRCTICGFILESEILPEDYICPICSQPASAFEKI